MHNFNFKAPIAVRWSDLDTFNHVNNAKYLTYLEEVRILYFRNVCSWNWHTDGMIVARIEIDYKQPILWGYNCQIGIKCSQIGNSSFVLDYEIWEINSPQIKLCSAKSIMVSIDLKTKKSCPLPTHYKEKISIFENLTL